MSPESDCFVGISQRGFVTKAFNNHLVRARNLNCVDSPRNEQEFQFFLNFCSRIRRFENQPLYHVPILVAQKSVDIRLKIKQLQTCFVSAFHMAPYTKMKSTILQLWQAIVGRCEQSSEIRSIDGSNRYSSKVLYKLLRRGIALKTNYHSFHKHVVCFHTSHATQSHESSPCFLQTVMNNQLISDAEYVS